MAEHAADHGAVELGGVVEYTDHRQTYDGFLKLLRNCLIAIVVVLVLMAFFLL